MTSSPPGGTQNITGCTVNGQVTQTIVNNRTTIVYNLTLAAVATGGAYALSAPVVVIGVLAALGVVFALDRLFESKGWLGAPGRRTVAAVGTRVYVGILVCEVSFVGFSGFTGAFKQHEPIGANASEAKHDHARRLQRSQPPNDEHLPRPSTTALDLDDSVAVAQVDEHDAGQLRPEGASRNGLERTAEPARWVQFDKMLRRATEGFFAVIDRGVPRSGDVAGKVACTVGTYEEMRCFSSLALCEATPNNGCNNYPISAGGDGAPSLTCGCTLRGTSLSLECEVSNPGPPVRAIQARFDAFCSRSWPSLGYVMISPDPPWHWDKRGRPVPRDGELTWVLLGSGDHRELTPACVVAPDDNVPLDEQRVVLGTASISYMPMTGSQVHTVSSRFDCGD